MGGKHFYDFSVMPIWNSDSSNFQSKLQEGDKQQMKFFEVGSRCLVHYGFGDQPKVL